MALIMLLSDLHLLKALHPRGKGREAESGAPVLGPGDARMRTMRIEG